MLDLAKYCASFLASSVMSGLTKRSGIRVVMKSALKRVGSEWRSGL